MKHVGGPAFDRRFRRVCIVAWLIWLSVVVYGLYYFAERFAFSPCRVYWRVPDMGTQTAIIIPLATVGLLLVALTGAAFYPEHGADE